MIQEPSLPQPTIRRHLNKALWLFIHKIPWKPLLIWGPWALILLVTLCYQVENWRGARALKEAKQLATTQGISLDWQDYAPSPIPEEENLLYSAPLVVGRVKSYRPLRHGGITGLSSNRKDFGARNSNFLAQPLELKKWLEPRSRPSTEAEAAQQLDLILADRKAALDELCRDLQSRTLQHEYDPNALKFEGNPFSFQRSHEITLQDTCRDDALIAIALQDTDRIFQRLDLLKAYLSAEWFPCLLEPLFKLVHLQAIDKIVWNLVAHQSLTLTETEHLLNEIKSLRLSADFPNFIAGELAHLQLASKTLEKSGPALALLPSGWSDRMLANSITRLLKASKNLDFRNSSDCREFHRRGLAELERKRSFPDNILDIGMLNGWINAMDQIQYTETTHQLTLIGLELDLFNRQHSRYPTTLTELEEDCGHPFPLDYFTGKPFRYRLKKDNTPLVWSAGLNRVNEDGLPERMKKEGDILWMLTPIAGLTEKDWRRQLRKHSGNHSRPR